MNKEIKSFYGLRALAVIFVSLYHMMSHTVRGGYLGVVIFLVMSGYLVTDSFFYALEQGRTIDIKKFWHKRIIRLYSPLLPMLVLTSIFALIFLRPTLYSYGGNLASSLFGVNNIYQIAQGMSYFDMRENVQPLTHLWSLGLEMQFYLVYPLLIIFLTQYLNLKKKIVGRILLVLSFMSASLMTLLYNPIVDVTRIYYGLDTRVFSFFIGGYFACVFSRQSFKRQKLPPSLKPVINGASFVLLGLITSLMWSMGAQSPFVFRFGMYGFTFLVGVLMLLLLMKGNAAAKFLSHPFFIAIGKRSYSLYLYQYMTMIFIQKYFLWQNLPSHILYSIEIIVALILTEVSYRLFEKKNNYLVSKNIKFRVAKYAMLVMIIMLPIYSFSATEPYESDVQKRIDAIMAKDVQPNYYVTMITDTYHDIKAFVQRIHDKKIKAHTEQLDTEQQEVSQEQSPPENDEPSSEEMAKEDQLKKYYTFIGDSVMLCAKEDIQGVFENSVIDAKVSRQYWDLEAVINDHVNSQSLYDDVVIHLGTNCIINKDSYVDVLKSLGSRRIYLINCKVPVTWEADVNQIISDIANEMENVTVIDWYGYSHEHKEWFYDDATHPNLLGAEKFAELLKTTLSEK